MSFLSDWHDGGGAALCAEHEPFRSRVLSLDRGGFDADHLIADPEESFGVLILDGLIMARIEAGRGHAGWLIGSGDLLRPWDMGEISLIRGTRWRALTPARILRLGRSVERRLCEEPKVMDGLLSRAVGTSHWLFAKSLVMGSPAVEERLVLLFALCGERWGRVTSDGVRLDLPLTHALIAELCGARRPTVSVALRSLEQKGVLVRTSPTSWLLRRGLGGDRPCQCWSQYVTTFGPAFDHGDTAVQV